MLINHLSNIFSHVLSIGKEVWNILLIVGHDAWMLLQNLWHQVASMF
jgi:hypothetical protein